MKKPKKQRPPRRAPRSLTFGDVLGEAVAQDRAEKARRKELEVMGFKPLKGAP